MAVERADFVSVPVQDMARAKRFYSETLGLHSPNLDNGWPEFETGNVSLYLVDPTRFGQEFMPHGVPHGHRGERAHAASALRAARTMKVDRVDFVSFLTQDMPRAKRFYTEVLGLEIEGEDENGNDMELTAGQVTLDIFDPASIGQPFAPSLAGLALRVPDVAAARAATRWTRVSATWRSSRIRTATR